MVLEQKQQPIFLLFPTLLWYIVCRVMQMDDSLNWRKWNNNEISCGKWW